MSRYETVVSDTNIERKLFEKAPHALLRLLELRRLRPADIALYVALSYSMRHRRGSVAIDGMTEGLAGAYPGARKLMRMIGLGSRDALFSSLRRLEAAGVIKRTRRTGTNLYAIRPVAEWQLDRPEIELTESDQQVDAGSEDECDWW